VAGDAEGLPDVRREKNGSVYSCSGWFVGNMGRWISTIFIINQQKSAGMEMTVVNDTDFIRIGLLDLQDFIATEMMFDHFHRCFFLSKAKLYFDCYYDF
jgi:hypothetical protein